MVAFHLFYSVSIGYIKLGHTVASNKKSIDTPAVQWITTRRVTTLPTQILAYLKILLNIFIIF